MSRPNLERISLGIETLKDKRISAYDKVIIIREIIKELDRYAYELVDVAFDEYENEKRYL